MTSVPPDLLGIVAALLPHASLADARLKHGQFHDVVLLPGVAAVRIARREAAARDLPRRAALLTGLATLGLPFEIPRPLTDVATIAGRAAVAVSWLDGHPLPRGEGDPRRLATLLATLREVPLTAFDDLLGPPHAYAGGAAWHELLLTEAVPRLPARLREEALSRIAAAAGLAPVEPVLVHGDLAGENVHWAEDGSLVGVLDWDLAQPFDQAVDVACLAWHGWDTVRAAVDAETYARARAWQPVFPLEQIVAAVLNGEPPEILDRYVRGVSDVLDCSRQ